MARILNILLAIAILCGVVLLVKRTSKLSELRAEHDRLAVEFGALDVKDPSKYLITRVETGDPMHFQWRCYYPPGLKVNERFGFKSTNSGGSTGNTGAGEYLHRVRFEVRKDHIRVHQNDRGGGGRLSALNAKWVEFLKDHWGELEFQVLASEGPVEVDTHQALEFLTIRIPKDLLPELEQRMGHRIDDKDHKDPFFQAVYGTGEAMAAFDMQQKKATR